MSCCKIAKPSTLSHFWRTNHLAESLGGKNPTPSRKSKQKTGSPCPTSPASPRSWGEAAPWSRWCWRPHRENWSSQSSLFLSTRTQHARAATIEWLAVQRWQKHNLLWPEEGYGKCCTLSWNLQKKVQPWVQILFITEMQYTLQCDAASCIAVCTKYKVPVHWQVELPVQSSTNTSAVPSTR